MKRKDSWNDKRERRRNMEARRKRSEKKEEINLQELLDGEGRRRKVVQEGTQ